MFPRLWPRRPPTSARNYFRRTHFWLPYTLLILPLSLSAVLVDEWPVFGLVVCSSVADGLSHVSLVYRFQFPIGALGSSCIWTASPLLTEIEKETDNFKSNVLIRGAIDFDSTYNFSAELTIYFQFFLWQGFGHKCIIPVYFQQSFEI